MANPAWTDPEDWEDEIAKAEPADPIWLQPARPMSAEFMAEATQDWAAIGGKPVHLDADDEDGPSPIQVLAWLGALVAMGFFFSWTGSLR